MTTDDKSEYETEYETDYEDQDKKEKVRCVYLLRSYLQFLSINCYLHKVLLILKSFKYL